MLTFRSYATETYEPCQIRKEAAVSRPFCVPWDSLDRAMNLSNAWDLHHNDGRMAYIDMPEHIHHLDECVLFILLKRIVTILEFKIQIRLKLKRLL